MFSENVIVMTIRAVLYDCLLLGFDHYYIQTIFLGVRLLNMHSEAFGQSSLSELKNESTS